MTQKNNYTKEEYEKLLFTADLPIEVVKPYFDQTLRIYNNSQKKLTEASGVPNEVIGAIAREQIESISIDDVDKISLVGDFSLYQVTEESIEWAKKNKVDWPVSEDYHDNNYADRKRIRQRKKV